jgi:hypothetical protein
MTAARRASGLTERLASATRHRDGRPHRRRHHRNSPPTAHPPAGSIPCRAPCPTFGFHQTEPLVYLPVTPLLVVEVLADSAFEHGRFRHSLRLVLNRPDGA